MSIINFENDLKLVLRGATSSQWVKLGDHSFVIYIDKKEWRLCLKLLCEDSKVRLKRLRIFTKIVEEGGSVLVAELASDVAQARISVRTKMASKFWDEDYSVKEIWSYANWMEDLLKSESTA